MRDEIIEALHANHCAEPGCLARSDATIDADTALAIVAKRFGAVADALELNADRAQRNEPTTATIRRIKAQALREAIAELGVQRMSVPNDVP